MAELSFFSPQELEKICTLLELAHLEVRIFPEWGSRSPNHREKIHQDLDQRTRLSGKALTSSISHCKSLGGYALSVLGPSRNWQMGFDIEEDARVSREVARRISISEKEYLAAPSPASLWTAKEAAYKALKGPHQPAVIAELEIENWRQIDSQFETASLKDSHFFGSNRIHGALIKKSSFTFSFFVRQA
jgi:phosphopantetheinyl transferase (holo-ACP synthase)